MGSASPKACLFGSRKEAAMRSPTEETHIKGALFQKQLDTNTGNYWCKWTSLQNRETEVEKELTFAGRKGREERIVREFGMDMCTLPNLKWITNKDLLKSTWNSAQGYVAPGREGVGGECVHVLCMAKSLCCSPESVTTLFISYTRVQN